MTSEPSDAFAPETTESPRAIPYADASVPTARDAAMMSGITRGDVAILAIRIVGIYTLLQALPTIAAMVRFGFGPIPYAIPFAVTILVLVGVGTVLVVKARMFAGWILPKVSMDQGIPPTAGSAEGLQATAFAVLGVVLMAWALPQFTALLWRYTYASIQSLPRDSGQELVGLLCKPGAELVIGLLLFFRGKRLAAYWQRLPVARRIGPEDAGPL